MGRVALPTSSMPSTHRPLTRLRHALLALGVLAFACGALLAAPPDRVLAHATLIASDPAEDVVVPLPPNRVTLSFTEPVESRLSSIEVTTTDGKRVDRDDLTTADSGRRVTVSRMPLDRGTYIVGWKNVSTVDGHPLSGRFAFHVGARSTDATITSTAPAFASRLEPPARFTLDAGLLALAGTLCVLAFVLRRSDNTARTEAVLRRLAIAATGLALAGGALQLLAQTSGTGGSLVDVLQGRWGTTYLVRVAAMLLAGVLVVLRRPRIALGAAIVALASISATSHGAAVQGLATPGIIVDALHLAAVAVWVGALPAMLLVIWTQRGGRGEAGEALRRFSTLALIAAGVTGLTGTYLAWLHVLRLSAVDSVYGWGVVAKFVLFGGLLVLGAVNRRWPLPALARGVRHRLRVTLGIEVAIGIGLVVAVAVMTSTLPARESLRAPLPGGVVTTADGMRIEIRVRPALPGTNEVAVRVRDARGQSVEGAAVALQAAPAGQAADIAVPAASEGGGLYKTSLVLGARGVWALTASVAPPQGFDQNASVRAEIGGGAAPAPHAVDRARVEGPGVGARGRRRIRGGRRRSRMAVERPTPFAVVRRHRCRSRPRRPPPRGASLRDPHKPA